MCILIVWKKNIIKFLKDEQKTKNRKNFLFQFRELVKQHLTFSLSRYSHQLPSTTPYMDWRILILQPEINPSPKLWPLDHQGILIIDFSKVNF